MYKQRFLRHAFADHSVLLTNAPELTNTARSKEQLHGESVPCLGSLQNDIAVGGFPQKKSRVLLGWVPKPLIAKCQCTKGSLVSLVLVPELQRQCNLVEPALDSTKGKIPR